MGDETGSRTIQGIEAPAAGTWEIDPVHTRGRASQWSGSIHRCVGQGFTVRSALIRCDAAVR
jgi:hypothetical protein